MHEQVKRGDKLKPAFTLSADGLQEPPPFTSIYDAIDFAKSSKRPILSRNHTRG
jgi:hypothetical protein